MFPVEMSEQARARVAVGSMSAVSAGLVVAIVLGVSIVAGHLLGPPVPGTSVGRARGAIPAASIVGPKTTRIALGAQAGRAATGHRRRAHLRAAIGTALSRNEPVPATVHVRANRSASVTASVGPVRVSVKTTTPGKVVGHVGHVVRVVHKVICTLLC